MQTAHQVGVDTCDPWQGKCVDLAGRTAICLLYVSDRVLASMLQAAALLERPHAWPRNRNLKEGPKVAKAVQRLAIQLHGRKRPRGASKDSGAKPAEAPCMPTAAEVLASDQPHLWKAVIQSGAQLKSSASAKPAVLRHDALREPEAERPCSATTTLWIPGRRCCTAQSACEGLNIVNMHACFKQ